MNERNIFLFDGIGALLSLCFTGLLLPIFVDLTGIPFSILQKLALLPFAYAVFSLSCFKFPAEIKPWMLKTIISANVFYCLVSLGLFFHLDSLTLLGKLLLVAEILVVLIVVFLELRVLRWWGLRSGKLGAIE